MAYILNVFLTCVQASSSKAKEVPVITKEEASSASHKKLVSKCEQLLASIKNVQDPKVERGWVSDDVALAGCYR